MFTIHYCANMWCVHFTNVYIKCLLWFVIYSLVITISLININDNDNDNILFDHNLQIEIDNLQ